MEEILEDRNGNFKGIGDLMDIVDKLVTKTVMVRSQDY